MAWQRRTRYISLLLVAQTGYVAQIPTTRVTIAAVTFSCWVFIDVGCGHLGILLAARGLPAHTKSLCFYVPLVSRFHYSSTYFLRSQFYSCNCKRQNAYLQLITGCFLRFPPFSCHLSQYVTPFFPLVTSMGIFVSMRCW